MALVNFDGFDWLPGAAYYPAQLQADQWYGGLPSMSADTAFGQGLSCYSQYLFGATADKAVGKHCTGQHTLGLRIKIIAGAQTVQIVNTMSTQGVQFALAFTGDGNIFLNRYVNGGAVLTSGVPAGRWAAGKWFYLEIKFTIGELALFEVRINTEVVLSIPSINLSDGNPLLGYARGFDVIRFGTDGGDRAWLWDDWYLADDEGDVNNDYLGNIRVISQRVVGPGDLTEWNIGGSAPAPTNWQSVLNANLDETKYVWSKLVGARDLYQVSPTLNTPSIFGVMIKGAYRLDDASQKIVRNTLRTDLGTDLEGADRYVDQNYRFYRDIYETNPDTGVGWTDTEVNLLQIGPKLVA